MCGPVALAAGAAGISAAGNIAGAISSRQMGRFQQRIALQNAQLERQEGLRELVAQDDQTSRILGEQTAAVAASGIDVQTGSPLVLFAESVRNAELDAQAIARRTNIRARDEELRGRAARARGRAGFIGGILGAGASLLAGASAVGSLGAAPTPASTTIRVTPSGFG